jgi:hypothetical protein
VENETQTTPQEAATEVATVADLQLINQDLSGRYIITSDIDASNEQGFSPIGNADQPFTGTINGQGHTIKGLTINRKDSERVGLFGVVSGATISDIQLSNISVTGTSIVGELVGFSRNSTIQSVTCDGIVTAQGAGGLVGHCLDSKIQDCTANITVPSTSWGSGRICGGLVGAVEGSEILGSSAHGSINAEGKGSVGGLIAAGDIFSSGASVSQSTVRNCSSSTSVIADNRVGGLIGIARNILTENSIASGDVTATYSNAGGLIGTVDEKSTVKESTATGPVTSNQKCGGLIGTNFGMVRDSYSTSTVSAKQKVGGLVGQTRQEGRVSHTYATGTVEGNKSTGGLIGSGEQGTSVSESYWDFKSTGQSISAILPNAFALSTKQMTGEAAVENMDGFDFENTWQTTERYPILRDRL